MKIDDTSEHDKDANAEQYDNTNETYSHVG